MMSSQEGCLCRFIGQRLNPQQSTGSAVQGWSWQPGASGRRCVVGSFSAPCNHSLHPTAPIGGSKTAVLWFCC
jgi:hypothetical protein